jgi:hypothetical protein
LDIPVERSGGGHYDPALEPRVARLELDLRDMKTTLDDLRTMVARIDAQIPYLATKADLADKPGKTYMWGILAALLTAYACGLAALAVLK